MCIGAGSSVAKDWFLAPQGDGSGIITSTNYDEHVSSSPIHHVSLANAGVNTAHYPRACPSSLAVTNLCTGNAVRLPPDTCYSVAPSANLN